MPCTGATLAQICRFPATRALAAQMMAEAGEVADKLGLRLRISIEQRIDGAEKVGEHKTSMLQDVEAGRPLEIEPLVGSFVELGRADRDVDAGDRDVLRAGVVANARMS